MHIGLALLVMPLEIAVFMVHSVWWSC